MTRIKTYSDTWKLGVGDDLSRESDLANKTCQMHMIELAKLIEFKRKQ